MPAEVLLPTPDGEPAEVPEFTLVHLSDTHLTSVGVAYNGVIDADAALDRVVAVIGAGADKGQHYDAVIASGDLTDTGDPDAYRRLRTALSRLDAPSIFATGNHDVRTVFHRELLGVESEDQLVQQHWLADRLRIVVLDSTVVNGGHGRFQQGTLRRLAEILEDPAPAGTILVLHHSPIPPPTPLLVYFALERASRSALAEVIRGSDVRLILSGHHHLAQSGSLAGIPVAVAGSTAIRTDPLARPGHEQTTRSSSFNLVRLYEGTNFTVSVIPVDGADQVFDLDPADCATVIARHPVH